MSVSVIQSELSALSVKELRERAATIGVDDDAIEDARDGDSPKSDIIALIDSKEALLRAERFRAERVAKTSPLAEELAELSLKELRVRAKASGCDNDAIEDARDGDSPKPDLIKLIIAKEEELAAELQSLSLKELRVRAVAEGVHEDAIEDARDGDTPKPDIIKLILACQGSGAESSAPKLEALVPARTTVAPVSAPAPIVVPVAPILKVAKPDDGDKDEEEEEEDGLPCWVIRLWFAYLIHTGVMVGLSYAANPDSFGRRRLGEVDQSLDQTAGELALPLSHYTEMSNAELPSTAGLAEAASAPRRLQYGGYGYGYSSSRSRRSYSSGYGYGGSDSSGITMAVLLGTGPAIHVLLLPFFMCCKKKQLKKESKRSMVSHQTELDDDGKSIIFNIKFSLGQKIFIFFIGNIIDLGSFIIGLAGIVGLDLSNFWFPMSSGSVKNISLYLFSTI
eukprot:COSAG06_NODE_3306_length_5529_cov_7.228913_1_plen_451_part_00